ncbi:MAG: N-acetylmuramoyl-L-alanine amidase [Actinomycetota bacterium]|nr:N-acetylmuramoyl-L-alanine amidase [Actinomycetota bacterium]
MTYPYIEGYQGHTSGPNGTITRIVVHGTVSPCQSGGARSVASYFQSPNAGGLAHYVVDPAEIIQCCHEDTACWHAPPNHGSIGVELCDPQTGPGGRWGDQPHLHMLHLAAQLVADLCKRHNLPVKYVDAAGLLRGETGITTHADVSQAWHQSDHTDPGPDFPMSAFIHSCQQSGAVPTPAPPHGDRFLHLTKSPMTGQDVKDVQHALNVAGNHLPEDGVYGQATADLVNQFNHNHGIKDAHGADARGVTAATWAELREIVHGKGPT